MDTFNTFNGKTEAIDWKEVTADFFVYPLKGGQGLWKKSVTLAPTGLAHDRQWCVIDQNKKAVTQREIPQLALIHSQAIGNTSLTLSFEERNINVSVSRDRPIEIQIHKQTGIPAYIQNEQASLWISYILGEPVTLVRIDESQTRQNPHVESFQPVNLSDSYPFLVANQSSLDAINQHLQEPIPMSRFRPNIVLYGLPAWIEDNIRILKIGSSLLRLDRPCVRCVVTTVDQNTGQVPNKKEPLATLGQIRNIRWAPFFNKYPKLRGVVFGWNASYVDAHEQRLSIDMPVSVEEWNQ